MVIVTGGAMQTLALSLGKPSRYVLYSSSFRVSFQMSTQPVKKNRHVSCYSEIQALLSCKRPCIPFCEERSYNAFNSSSYLSRNFFGSYFGQKMINVNTFDMSPGRITTKASQHIGRLEKSMKRLLFPFLKAIASFCLLALLVIAATPVFLSWSPGLQATVFLTNKIIPGSASIKSMSLGWTKPITIEDIVVQGVDGDSVLVIPKIETKAPLWSIVTGKGGFGNCVIFSPIINLQEDKATGLSQLALAIIPREKLKGRQKTRVSKSKMAVPGTHVDFMLNIKAPHGDLQITNGKLILPEDVAEVVGKVLIADVLLGQFATERGEGFATADYISGLLPIYMALQSECTEAKAEGFINPKKMSVQLINPIKVEMDLTPSVGRIYLRRINPLLGEVLGPLVGDENMPDMIIYILPVKMILPAEHFQIHIEPIKAILARGPLVGNILSLLSKGKNNIAQGRQELEVVTSAIDVDFDMGGSLTCSRFDLLLAGRIHLATWGFVNWIEETVKMTLAIPEPTLRDLLGLSNLTKNFYLKIPIKGTFDQPQVDWKSASFNIAQLVLQERSGNFMKSILKEFTAPEEPIPESDSPLPWKSRDHLSRKRK